MFLFDKHRNNKENVLIIPRLPPLDLFYSL